MSFNNKSIYLTEITVPDLEALIANVIRKELEPHLQNLMSQQKQTEDSYVSRKEAAAILKISIPTLTKLVTDGLLPGYRLGNSIRFKKSSLEKGLVEIRSKKYKLGMAMAN
jgi:excisionase family DNA binding protein